MGYMLWKEDLVLRLHSAYVQKAVTLMKNLGMKKDLSVITF